MASQIYMYKLILKITHILVDDMIIRLFNWASSDRNRPNILEKLIWQSINRKTSFLSDKPEEVSKFQWIDH